MLGLFGPEVVQFFEMDGPILTFVSKGVKKLEQELKVRLALVDYKVKHVDIPLKIVDCKPTGSGKTQFCQGAIEMSVEHLQQLENLLYNFSPRPDLGEAARRSPRLPIGLKTVSREIPGYNCVTVDISRHGVLLSCPHGAVEPGTIVHLAIEADMANLQCINAAGRVVSCRESSEGKSKNKPQLVGVDFVGASHEQIETLQYYTRVLAGRLKGDVMTRQIADGEMTARNDPAAAPLSFPGAPPPPPPI
ncbi:PilZ domain-containing protein [bacterium]|nr:PilZ domain-containing protein [bacterium]